MDEESVGLTGVKHVGLPGIPLCATVLSVSVLNGPEGSRNITSRVESNIIDLPNLSRVSN